MDQTSIETEEFTQVAPRLEERRGQLLLEVSNAIVRIHKQYYGKGPTKARSHMSQDLLVVVLEGGYTHSEQSLLAAGHGQEVVRGRLAMQETAEAELRAAVESIVARPVRSFMSANDPDADTQVEIFLFGSTDPDN